MTAKQFFDWQTDGGTDDVMRLVDCLERSDVAWCAINGVAVNHWAEGGQEAEHFWGMGMGLEKRGLGGQGGRGRRLR